MKCKDSRELIMTDHIDGGLSEARRNELERHLLSCAACGELAAAARKNLGEIFANVKKAEPPAYLWQSIRDRIALDRAREGLLSNSLARIRDISAAIFRIPKPVMAFAATAIIIIAILAAVPVIRGRALDNYLNEQADFMVRLDVSEANGDSIFDTDVRTGIEILL